MRIERLVLVLAASLGAGMLTLGWQPVAAQDAAGQTPAVGAGAPARGQRGGGRAGSAPRRKRVLAWADTRNGIAQHESIGHALATIERLGYESGMWDTDIRTDSNIIANAPKRTDGTPASGGPSLVNVDAIFFMGHREVSLDDSQKAELLQFVRDGHGFVAAHVGLTAFESWPEFGEMLGGRFDQHPIVGAGTVVNEDPSFPATKHFPGSFPFTDEFYQPKDLSRDKVDVLLRLDLTTVPANPALHLSADYPLAWAKMYGKGRVFYGSFAHAAETWDLRSVRQMYFEAMRWALGLTEGTATPHEQRAAAPPGRGLASR